MRPSRALPRRVLMTADAVGGVWHYGLELARGLAGSEVEVLLAVLGPPPTSEQRLTAASIDGVTLVHHGCALEWMPGAERDLGTAGSWLLSLTESFAPDLVHLNGFAHGTLPWQVPTLVVAHSCVLSWWRAVHGHDAPAEWADYRRRTRAGLQAADLVVAPTRAFLEQVQTFYGPLRRTLWIWNGCSPAEPMETGKEPLIFAAGRIWDEGKNLQAVAAISHRLVWPLAVAGAGAPKYDDSALAPWLGALSSDAIRCWYARASVFVLPARYEPFGLAALEAAMAGCALVLGDIPTLRELWDGAALFVPPDHHEELVAALNTLAGDPELLGLLGGLARSRAEGYSAARMNMRYLHAYAGLLAAPPHAVAALAS